MISIAEEIVLLLLEDEEGRFVQVPDISVRCVLAGAVLMELALKNKIDTDLENLVVIDPAPVGDALLDPFLKRIVESDESHDARWWVEFGAREYSDLRGTALERLCESGVLEKREDKFLWVLQTRRYPIRDGKVEREVKHRIMSILFSDEIPDPRDIVIISLVDTCGLFKFLLSEREHKRALERISTIRQLDLIGREVSNAVREIEASLALALHPPF